MRRRFPLSRQHLKELERLFHAYDFDKSGTIDMDEMRTLLKDVDNKMTALPAVCPSLFFLFLNGTMYSSSNLLDCAGC